MEKILQLVCTNISYDGDNIGQRFKLTLKKKGNKKGQEYKFDLQCNNSIILEKVLYEEMISKNGITDFTLSLEELDKYPDSSRTSFSIGYDSETGKNHHFAIQLQLIENNPKIITNKKATIQIVFNLKYIKPETKTLITTNKEGWITAYAADAKQGISIPYGTKVEYYYIKDNYEYFRIIEGRNFNKKKKIILKTELPTDYKSRFSNKIQYKSPCKVYFNIRESLIKVKGIGGYYPVVMDYNQILPIGVYHLELLDSPHNLYGSTEKYLRKNIHARSWFRIKNKSKEEKKGYFLHFGSISEGCVTIDADSKGTEIFWERVYQKLTLCREENNTDFIGTIQFLENWGDIKDE